MLDVRYINQAHRTGRRRAIELQCRFYGIDPLRIEGFGPNEGADEVLPHSDLAPQTKALMATWYLHVRAIGQHGARNDAPWLLLLEDDALFAPRFASRAAAALASAPDDCLLVQLGFLSKYTWFSPRGMWLNMVMAALYVVRGEWLRSARQRGGGDDPNFSRELFVGSHATAVRVRTIPELLDLLEPYEHVTDLLFRARARQHPGRILRSRRQLAVQNPFTRSGLRIERRARAAAAGVQLDVRPVATGAWMSALRSVAAARSDDDARWLILADGAVLAPQFETRTLAVLHAVPADCDIVQLCGTAAHDRTDHDVQRLYTTATRPEAHTVAVRIEAIPQLLTLVEPTEESVDALMRRVTEDRGAILTSRRRLAYRMPRFAKVLATARRLRTRA